jgi:hypothetical protein
MKSVYQVKSDRYNYTHYLVKDGDPTKDNYRFVPEYTWMSMRLGYGPNNEIEFIDTDGGPFITKGWSNGIIKVNEFILEDNKIYLNISAV